jgi:Pyruvate/2-oxoacid:ferredoxin oxidoreductase gamma subunit
VADGLAPEGFVLLNADEAPPELAAADVRCVPASRLAAERGSSFANVVMLGAVARALGEPTLAAMQEAAVELLGRKVDADAVREAVEEGFAWAS